MPDTYDTVRSVLTGVFRVPEDEIRPRRTLEELDLDSLALTELVLVLHERSGVRIGNEDLSRGTTLAQVAGHLDALLADGASTVAPS